MPGTASIVRDAIISVENGPVLALWQPGGDVTVAPSGDAFRLPAGSKLHLQIEVQVTPLSDNSDEPKTAARFPLQIALDYVRQ